MKAHRYLLPCPQCGEQFSLRSSEFKRNANLTLTCASCGHVHLALNTVRASIHQRMKEAGYPVGEPPVPQPIEPISVFRGEDGSEAVIRRNKKGGETLSFRRAGRKPRKSK